MRTATHPLRSALLTALLPVVTFLPACRASGDGRVSAAPASAATVPSTTSAGDAAPATVVSTAIGSDSTALRAAADAGRIAGAATAKVWLIVASDFQCPYCKIWHDQTYAALRHEYVESGKVRIAYLNYPLDMHVQAMPAAEAAMCASAQSKFWEYHTALFTSQDRWAKAGDQNAAFDSLANATGLDAARFRSCTRSHVMRALILADEDRMASRGVQSTPSFFVGNKTVAGAQPTDDFRRLLDAALAPTP